MTRKFGLILVALAAAVLVASENESLAGRRHRGGCGSCGSCGTACDTGACEVPAEAAPAAPAPPATPAPSAAAPQAQQPSVVVKATTSPEPTQYVSRRTRRGWRR